MGTRRSVVDYGLARRATLASVQAGRITVADVCDAHPYLLRAAKFHGEPTEIRCPICRKAKLTHVTYVYGDELGQYEGRVKRGPELDEMAAEYANSGSMWSKSAKVVAGTTLHRLTFLALASRVRDAAAGPGQASRNAPASRKCTGRHVAPRRCDRADVPSAADLPGYRVAAVALEPPSAQPTARMREQQRRQRALSPRAGNR